jgi:hypothetical protein
MDELHIPRHDKKLVPKIPERSLIQFSTPEKQTRCLIIFHQVMQGF